MAHQWNPDWAKPDWNLDEQYLTGGGPDNAFLSPNPGTSQGLELTAEDLENIDNCAHAMTIESTFDPVGEHQGFASAFPAPLPPQYAPNVSPALTPAFAPPPAPNLYRDPRQQPASTKPERGVNAHWVPEYHRLRQIGEIDDNGLVHGVDGHYVKQDISNWVRNGIPKKIQDRHQEIVQALFADRHLGNRFTLSGSRGLKGTWSEIYEQYYRHLGGRIPSEFTKPDDKGFLKCHKRLYSHRKGAATSNPDEFEFFESHPDWKDHFLRPGTRSREFYEQILAEQRKPTLPTPGPSTMPAWQSAPVPTPTDPATWDPAFPVASAAGMSLAGAGHRPPPVGSFPPPAAYGNQAWRFTPGAYQQPGGPPRPPSPRH
ncbi:hypothetical protein [Micromonospora sp. SH-82]|uniref:hypothetical protein n=1 Tax=Micromonospora sp. SH-82 TaxID=3132938 RepID=UPI003EB6A641